LAEYNYAELASQLGIIGRRSGEQLIARCPLHQERNPSFSLNLKHGAWTCFAGCGQGGFHRLVMRVNSCSIVAAHDWMLNAAALMPVKNPDANPPVELLPDMRWASLFNSVNRDEMPQWWFDRGFTWETTNTWDIRWNGEHGQLIIPFYKYPDIQDEQLLLGTITRNLKNGPKYVNSPGLPRSKYLYGLTAQHGPLLILTEGPLDHLWLQQNKIAPSAALLGLNMSEEHIRLLHGFDEICLALDNDYKDKVNHGEVATQEIATRLMKSGRISSQVTRLRLPAHRKDVGESTALELEQALKDREVV